MDLGTLYGAIVVERLRTFNRQVPEWNPHWNRFQQGCQTLGIRLACTKQRFEDALHSLIDANSAWISHEPDVSLIAVATPGNPEFGLGDCTMYLHVQKIPWGRLRSWYREGASLVASEYATGAGTCWPAPIKIRNRLSYYLADRSARAKCSATNAPARALGLVSTANGTVADTSVANLLIIDPRGQWISPTPNTVMLGTSLRKCESLLANHSTKVLFRDIAFEELNEAREVVLVGNTACVWHVSEWEGQSIADGQAGPHCKWLQKLWIEHVGFDWLSQGSTEADRIDID